jgi:hypothetical protein
VLAYVVLVAKPRRTIPAWASGFASAPDVPELAFVPTAHHSWSSAGGHVRFGGWQRPDDVVALGSHWHVDQNGLTAFSGRTWPHGSMWRDGESWSAQLAHRWCELTPVLGGQPLGGIFTAVSLRSDGTGTLATDPLSIGMLYRADHTDFIAYSSNCHLAARAATPPDRAPERDPMTAAWLPFMADVVGDRTGFTNTMIVPAGSFVDIGPNFGSRLRAVATTPWSIDSSAGAELPDVVELVREDLSLAVRSVARLPAAVRRADLTGGRDSRLVLALMVDAGVANMFSFQTTGFVDSPDAIVATDLAERCGLEHRRIEPMPIGDQEFENRVRTHVFQSSGMVGTFDLRGGLRMPTELRIGGMLGELLRTHFKSYPMFDRLDDLAERYSQYHKLDAVGILRPDVRSDLDKALRAELIERADTAGTAPEDHLDAFYLRNRLRRWFGTLEEYGQSGHVYPLYSLVAVQGAFAIGGRARWDQRLMFEVMRAASPLVTSRPLANYGWSESIITGLPDADRYREPPIEPPRGRFVAWQPSRLENNRDVVRALLLDDSTNPVFDIVDRAAVEAVLAGPVPTKQQQPQALFGALTAAVWLGNQESGFRIGAGWDQTVVRRARSPVRRIRVTGTIAGGGPTTAHPHRISATAVPSAMRRVVARVLPTSVGRRLGVLHRRVHQRLRR